MKYFHGNLISGCTLQFRTLNQHVTKAQPYHKVDEVIGGVAIVDKLIVDNDEVLDGAVVIVGKHDVV